MTLFAEFMAIEHGPVPEQAPDHVSKALPVDGEGTSETVVPNEKDAVHEPELQVSPAGLDVTLPAPAPAMDTVST